MTCLRTCKADFLAGRRQRQQVQCDWEQGVGSGVGVLQGRQCDKSHV